MSAELPSPDVLAPTAATRLDRAERGYRWARAAMIALSVLTLVVGGGLLLILQLQSRDIAAGVESCITPGGECYERSARREDQHEEMREQLDAVLLLLCEERPEHEVCAGPYTVTPAR